MTIAEFLSALADVRDEFDWSLATDTGRHAERRAKPRFHIRGTSRVDGSITLDPLRALCYARTGTVFEPTAWSDVADSLKMTDSAVSTVLSASNDRTWAGEGKGRTASTHLVSVRQGVLEAVGLEVGVA